MKSRIIFAIVWAALVFGAYWLTLRGAFWALDKHPLKLIAAILLAGLPIGYYATRHANRDAQKRAIWSALRDQTAKGGLSIAAPEPDDSGLGAAMIDDVLFKSVSIRVTDEGIRLDRPFVDTRPISIPWGEIQRVDLLTHDIEDELVSVAAIRAKHSDVKLIVFPWTEDHQGLVPETVGESQLRVSS